MACVLAGWKGHLHPSGTIFVDFCVRLFKLFIMKKAYTLAISLSISVSVAIPAHSQTIQWLRGILGHGSNDGQAVAIDSSGNCYATGWIQDTAYFDPDHRPLISDGNLNGFLVKYDANGNILWLKKFSGPADVAPNGLAIDAFGNCFVTGAFLDTVKFPTLSGSFDLSSAGSADIFIAKYDSNGNFIWAKRAGGTLWDDGVVISAAPSGVFAIAGDFEGTSEFGNLPNLETIKSASDTAYDLFVALYNPDGSLQWVAEGGGPATDHGNAVAVSNDNTVYAGGTFEDTATWINGFKTFVSAGSSDDILLKLTATGSPGWATRIGGHREDFLNGISVADGKCYFIARNGNGVQPPPDTVTYDSSGLEVALDGLGPEKKIGMLAAFDASSGFRLWEQNVNVNGYCNPTALAQSPDRKLFVAGEFQDTVSFSYSSDSTTKISRGADDLYLSEWDTSGVLKWVNTGGSIGNDFVYGIAADSTRCVGTGTFEDALVYQGLQLISQAPDNAFVYSFRKDSKFSSPSLVREVQSRNLSFSASIVGNLLSISGLPFPGKRIRICNVLGNEVYPRLLSPNISSTSLTFDLSALPKGLLIIDYDNIVRKVIW